MPAVADPPARSAAVHLPLLQSARIATACPARWEDMRGDDKTRYCSLCNLNVHNIAAMSPGEAERALAPLLEGQRVCARLWRRADGTIITRDCPVGLARVRAGIRRSLGRAAAALGLATLWSQASSISAAQESMNLRVFTPIRWVVGWFKVEPVMGKMMAGDVCLTPAPVPAPAPAPAPAGPVETNP